MTDIRIIGAGMAGLLAANMLRRFSPYVYEKANELPNNHNSVLRFRSSIVGDTLGIPFKKVNMIKAPVTWKNPVADALMYSYKNTGVRRSDRSITSGLVSEVRYIAPPNLIQLMFDGIVDTAEFNFGKGFDFHMPMPESPTISTIPMPLLMNKLNYCGQPEFTWSSGATFQARIKDCDAYVSLLVPDPAYTFSRISITGDELFVEVPNGPFYDDDLKRDAAELLGIDAGEIIDCKIKQQKFSKINPIDDDARKAFMHWATVNHNIYSLGRFATWRPNLLLDDLVNDVRMIEKWIGQGNKYDTRRMV